MRAADLVLVLVSLVTFVSGQLLLKLALGSEKDETDARPTHQRVVIFVAGIVGMTISFFVNLGLLQRLELSLIFPFQGLSVIIVTLGACVFLKERLTAPLVVGAVLVTAGVMLVSVS